jgi:hypothetical protein
VNNTTLSVAVGASERAIQVASATGFAVGRVCQVEEELMLVTNLNGTFIDVFRGVLGTKAVAHVVSVAAHVGLPTEFPYENVGTAATGISAVEVVNGRHHITTLTFEALALLSATSGAHAGGALIYTLPAGTILVKGVSMNVLIEGASTTNDADTPDVGIGTTVASGAVSVLGGTAAFENILTGQTASDCATTYTLKTLDCTLAIESTGDHTVYQNVADSWAGSAAMTGTGTVVLEWLKLS